MNMRDLIPWTRERSAVPSAFRGDEVSPFLTLHREMNRLFDDVFGRFGGGGMPTLFGRMTAWPSIELVPSDKDVKVMAELPGMDEKDVEVLLDEDVLTIRGEKKIETEDRERRFSERYYGRFERVIPLPFAVEEDQVEASFSNGVLTVTLPKSARAQEKAKRIAISGKSKEKDKELKH
ncbi:MAG TPA: Hsp20/alpha crystallin family protein [Microvirga sp.]|nr:Hsp20/alpha crystallin family protein [Microvirga sp.]